MKRVSLLFIIFSIPIFLFAQADTIPSTEYKFLQKSILPTSLILAGSLLSGQQNEIRLKNKVLKKYGSDPNFGIDDYLPFMPIAELYLADLLHVEAKNHWFDQSKNLFMTVTLNQIIVTSLKYGINKTRPNGEQHAFPSGHTSFAFATAAVLQEEFKETSPILSYTGYGFAVSTGALRVINNQHWLSDVLVGAGIGILSAKIIYHFEPLKHWNPFRKKKNVVLLPYFSSQLYGVRSSIVF